jgi:hypothetical protein
MISEFKVDDKVRFNENAKEHLIGKTGVITAFKKTVEIKLANTNASVHRDIFEVILDDAGEIVSFASDDWLEKIS